MKKPLLISALAVLAQLFNAAAAQTTEQKLLVARSEGITVTVTDIDGNEVPSGSFISPDEKLTITATATDHTRADKPVTLQVNKADFTSGETFTVADTDVIVTGIFTSQLAKDYCHLTGNSLGIFQGGITSLDITDGTSSVTVTGPGTGFYRPIYKYDNAVTLYTSAGATLSITPDASLIWGWKFGIFADFDGSKAFNDGNPAQNELLVSTGNTNAVSVTLPASLRPGRYRMRALIDSDSKNPCGNTHSGWGGLFTGSASILDFDIVIPDPITGLEPEPAEGDDTDIEFTEAPDVYELTASHTSGGSLDVWSRVDAEGRGAGIRYESGEGVFFDQPLYVFITPDENHVVDEASIQNSSNKVDKNNLNTDGRLNLFNVVGNVDITAVFGDQRPTAIDTVTTDQIDFNAPVEYYTLQGIRLSADRLSTGIYIVRQGDKTAKIHITK